MSMIRMPQLVETPDGFRPAERELAWDMTGPCADCPFRRDAPEHEGVCAAIVGYVKVMDEQRFAHTCHKTDPVADGPVNGSTSPPTLQHCGGALHFMVRAGHDMQLPLAKAIDARKIDVVALAKRARRDERIFASVREMVEYYLAMATRIMAARKSDPPVYVYNVDGFADKPLPMLLSDAKAAGREIVECVACGAMAVQVDRLWPYHMEQTLCAKCGGSSTIGDTVAELEGAAR